VRIRIHHIDQIAVESSSCFLNPITRLFFIRAVYLYFFIKIILTWEASILIEHVIQFEPIKSPIILLFFLPEEIFNWNPDVFLLIGLLLTIINSWKPNYSLSALIFWYAANYFRLHYPIINGADIVLVLLLFISIGLSIYPVWKKWIGFQRLVFNGASLLIKLQIAIIYLLSGVDKLYSSGWRDGDAIHYMLSLEYLMNPRLTGLIPDMPWLNFIVSWGVIAFEILFPFLIWNQKTRLWMLLIGTLFHIGISIVLSLVDFGLIMIISYLIFLKDDDLNRIGMKKLFIPTPALS
jgi:hypothetical protein